MGILHAATQLFLEKGYEGVSTEDVARGASASKQTVYKYFGDKSELFRQIVLDVTDQAERIVERLSARFDEMTDPATELPALAREYATAVLRPEVLQLRRLVISEAERFPDLARAYFEAAPARATGVLAAGFRQLGRRGLLPMSDPDAAATDFAYAILGPLVDRAMFLGRDQIRDRDIRARVDAGVRALLATYAADPRPAIRRRRGTR